MTRRYAIGVLNGNWKHQWKRDSEIWSDKTARIIEKNKERFGDSLSDLKSADPTGWEVWYDDDANIPSVIYWTDDIAINSLCNRMRERAQEVVSGHCQGAFQKIPP